MLQNKNNICEAWFDHYILALTMFILTTIEIEYTHFKFAPRLNFGEIFLIQ